MSRWFRSARKLDEINCDSQIKVESKLSPQVIAVLQELQQLIPDQIENLLSQLCIGLRKNTDEEMRYRAAELLANTVYSKYKFSEYARLFLEDQVFLDFYSRFMDVGNWHSLDRKYTLNQLLKLIANLDGDFAECGVYKGFSAYLMCEFLQKTNRIVHLFDSFEGLSVPEPCDGHYWVKGALNATQSMLRQTLARFNNYRVYQGWIPEHFQKVSHLEFSFVHIDVDLYRPTYDSLAFFYVRVQPGGIILFDDYGFKTCPGAKQAVDEFFTDRTEPIIMLPTGQAFVIKQFR